MRHVALAFALAVGGCTIGDPATPNPPVLQVMSPARSTIADQAGQVTVSGTVAQNPMGAPVQSVVVNGVTAAMQPGGAWSATVDVAPGATLIHTVATDIAGGIATDTRSIEAGMRVAPGTMIGNALATSISANAFGQIANVATGIIKQANLTQLLGALNPIVSTGSAGDCLNGQAFIDSVTISNAKISLSPVNGGLQVGAELDGVNLAGHVTFDVLCAPGSDAFTATATTAVLDGVLDLMPGSGGSDTGLSVTVANPNVTFTGLNVNAGGIPTALLDILPISKIASALATAAAPTILKPVLNSAVGALEAPMQISLMGQTIDFQVEPSAASFTTAAGTVALDMKLLIEGTENSAGFTSTPSGPPVFQPGNGLALGLCDDLANEALSELTATGLLNLSLPAMAGGAAASIAATSPPMISANGSDGNLELILPDLELTITQNGNVAGKAALNVEVGVKITPAANDPSSVQIDLGEPAIALDPLSDPTADSASAMADGIVDFHTPASMGASTQLSSITSLLQSIPLPKLLGLQLTDTSVTGQDGYVTVQTTLQ